MLYWSEGGMGKTVNISKKIWQEQFEHNMKIENPLKVDRYLIKLYNL